MLNNIVFVIGEPESKEIILNTILFNIGTPIIKKTNLNRIAFNMGTSASRGLARINIVLDNPTTRGI